MYNRNITTEAVRIKNVYLKETTYCSVKINSKETYCYIFCSEKKLNEPILKNKLLEV